MCSHFRFKWKLLGFFTQILNTGYNFAMFPCIWLSKCQGSLNVVYSNYKRITVLFVCWNWSCWIRRRVFSSKPLLVSSLEYSKIFHHDLQWCQHLQSILYPTKHILDISKCFLGCTFPLWSNSCIWDGTTHHQNKSNSLSWLHIRLCVRHRTPLIDSCSSL